MAGQKLRTLIVGGVYTEFDGVPYVPERCWRMVRIFADRMAQPYFSRRRVASEDRNQFATRFPHPERLTASNPRIRRTPWELALPDVPWNRRWYERLVDQVDAVYCRLPSSHWPGIHVYNLAVERGKLAFASLHGDWPGTYRLKAEKVGLPLSPFLQRDARAAHEAFVHVAKTARVLFYTGDHYGYGDYANATVTWTNYLHSESDLFHREDTCQSPPYRIIFVGELSDRKGVPHLVDAAASLRSKGIPVELSLVGKGDQRDAIVRRAEAAGLADYLTLHGYISFGQEVFELYRKADLFVLPSVVGEAAPKVIVEAMSQGLPVVATDVGSTARTLEQSGGGIPIPPGDSAALAEALRRIIEEPELRRELIRKGLAFARATTNEYQRGIVAEALERYVPEIVKD